MEDNIFSVLFFEEIITILLFFGSTWPEVVKEEQGGKPHATEACRPRLILPPARENIGNIGVRPHKEEMIFF